MTLSNDNILIIYNKNDEDSRAFATYYAQNHSIDYMSEFGDTSFSKEYDWEISGQIVGINCSSSEILRTEYIFNSEILYPIREVISYYLSIGKNIYGVLLGYNVPGGFYLNGMDSEVRYNSLLEGDFEYGFYYNQSLIEGDFWSILNNDDYQGEDVIISSTSRVSRGCAHNGTNLTYDSNPSIPDFSLKIKNKLYNRSIFKRFGDTDTQHAIICSRIDAPTLLEAKNYVDNGILAYKQKIVNGKLYIDPYSDIIGEQADSYSQKILDFKDNLANDLNLDIFETSFLDPYIDVVFPYARDDSFVWSWFTDRASSSFFKENEKAIRFFFYNADYDGAFSVREASGRWCYLSLNSGYSSTAGAMSNPGISGFLNPNSFFKAIKNDATIGEAYLFSLPYLDWTVTLFGDPLVQCEFPGVNTDESSENFSSVDYSWLKISETVSRMVSAAYSKSKSSDDLLYYIADIDSSNYGELSVTLENMFLYDVNDFYLNSGIDSWKSIMKPLVNELCYFPTLKYEYTGNEYVNPSLNDFLSSKSYKISRLIGEVYGSGVIDEDFLYDEGWWKFEYILNDDNPLEYTNYHFLLNVYGDKHFENLILSLDSKNISNWYYEFEKDNFIEIPYDGMSSSFVGRRVMYSSSYDNYLERGRTYYFSITPYNYLSLEEYPIRRYSDIIYT